MATYNGAKHIVNQLDSIMNQSYDNIDLYIRDDGSTDDTVAIVKEYMESHKNITGKKIILVDGHGVNLRCPESFYELIRVCDRADYYALCDQDDFWYEDKIKWAVEMLENQEIASETTDEMLLYYSACDYKDENGRFIKKSHLQTHKPKIENVLYYTLGSGFTIVFNNATREKLVLNTKPGPEMHDRWLIRGAVCFGKVLYDERCTATHIRHAEAVTAGDASRFQLLKNFIKNELFRDDAVKEKKALRYFYRTFKDELTKREQNILKLFATKNPSLKIRMRKVFYKGKLRGRLTGELALRFMFLIGKI